ncbi:hypothetical protein Vi05172_g7291 [Venturia inaequalis]|nr:hypothetical protein Vi05172_g7291 [Venturia inaequalis]
MSLKQTYNLAHTARCKLHLAADRPDRDLRFLVGHAMHLDSLMLRIIEIEENVEPPLNASGGLSFKGVAHASSSKSPLSDSKSRRSPPPPKSAEDESSDDDDDDDGGDDDGGIGKYEEEAEMGGGELSLSRFPSGSARPPPQRDIASAPGPELSDGDESSSSSSSDEGEYTWDPSVLRDLVRTDSDEGLKKVYRDVSSCPCHKGEGPVVERMWEVLGGMEGGKEGVRYAVAELGQAVAVAA